MFFKSNGNIRDGSRTAATPKMEHFVIIVNGLEAQNYLKVSLNLIIFLIKLRQLTLI